VRAYDQDQEGGKMSQQIGACFHKMIYTCLMRRRMVTCWAEQLRNLSAGVDALASFVHWK